MYCLPKKYIRSNYIIFAEITNEEQSQQPPAHRRQKRKPAEEGEFRNGLLFITVT